MPRDIPAIRILPMSDKIPGFRGRSIEDVQEKCFRRDLPAMKGRYRYQSTGLTPSRDGRAVSISRPHHRQRRISSR